MFPGRRLIVGQQVFSGEPLKVCGAHRCPGPECRAVALAAHAAVAIENPVEGAIDAVADLTAQPASVKAHNVTPNLTRELKVRDQEGANKRMFLMGLIKLADAGLGNPHIHLTERNMVGNAAPDYVQARDYCIESRK